MDIRYSANQRDVKRYTTQELRDEFLIQNLYAANEVVAVYSHVDRMVTLGCMPTTETVSIDKGIDCWKNFGTHYFLEDVYKRQVYQQPAVTIVELMGRHAGWVTAAAALARKFPGDNPLLIYMPEVPFSMEQFFKDVDVYKRQDLYTSSESKR